MKISELIILTENKLSFLNTQMTTLIQHGSANEISSLEQDILETQVTLNYLRNTPGEQ